MAKATKKSQDPTKNIKPSTSGTKAKKAKTRRETKTRTAGKKDGEPSSRSCKVAQVITKVKKTRPRSPKRKASEKTTTSTKKTKKANKKSLFGHYHRLMEEMARTETDPGQSSLESSSVSTSDLESQ
ncbi:histone H1.0-B-like [Peromyscus eremicus]|uniref:histone H1.0-B-like n=1 Tax=Peromyscus eremicus TaxID=42410 RepID=UPI0027DDA7BC|nr:histone H1.0-B-like [Peromyscus eremicus]